jgi:membrane-bound acyltransferase YfiQ involved in biofilm formation
MFFAISNSSYIIYLFHTTFEGFSKAIFSKLTIGDSWYMFICEAIVVVSVGVFAPVLLYRILKKWKLSRFLFGLGTKKIANEKVS